eukprot:COSAG01_NODE_33946_length_558_cov_0.571116_1_plen_104_part_01
MMLRQHRKAAADCGEALRRAPALTKVRGRAVRMMVMVAMMMNGDVAMMTNGDVAMMMNGDVAMTMNGDVATTMMRMRWHRRPGAHVRAHVFGCQARSACAMARR